MDARYRNGIEPLLSGAASRAPPHSDFGAARRARDGHLPLADPVHPLDHAGAVPLHLPDVRLDLRRKRDFV